MHLIKCVNAQLSTLWVAFLKCFSHDSKVFLLVQEFSLGGSLFLLHSLRCTSQDSGGSPASQNTFSQPGGEILDSIAHWVEFLSQCLECHPMYYLLLHLTFSIHGSTISLGLHFPGLTNFCPDYHTSVLS